MTMSDADFLPWPAESARVPKKGEPSFRQVGANICLDFHGDPARATLVVFSDGNHHMALEECVASFLVDKPDVGDIFYATTPPAPLVRALEKGVLHVGNLALSVSPNVFISPETILDGLVASGAMKSHRAFAVSRGTALLVRRGNPKDIQGVADFMRDDVCVAMSNPENETASFQVYVETLVALADEAGLDGATLKNLFSENFGRVICSNAIHHREVPQMLADGRADVALVYYHLALRYCRIFPEVFDMVALGGTWDNPQPGPAHRITRYHLGLIGDGGDWGPSFVDFMLGDAAGAIYEKHGLRRLS